MIEIITLAVIFIGATYLILNKAKSGNKGNNVESIMPVRCIEDQVYISGNAAITIGYEIEMPWIFCNGHEILNHIHEAWINLVKLLPDNATLHKQEYISVIENKLTDKGKKGILSRHNMENLQKRNVVLHRSKIFVTFQKEGNENENQATYSPFERPYRITDERKQEIIRETNNIENALKAIPDVRITRLNNQMLGEALEEYWNLNYSEKSNLPYDQKVINPIQIEKEFVKIGGKYIKVLTLKTEGQGLSSARDPVKIKPDVFGTNVILNGFVELPVSMIYPISVGLPIDHIVNTVITKRNNDDIEKMLKAQVKVISPLIALSIPKAIQKEEEINWFINEGLNRQNNQGAETAVNIILFDENKDRLDLKIKHAKAAFMRMKGATCYEENLDTFNCFKNSSPGNAFRNKETIINAVEQAVCYIQKESMVRSMDKGYLFVDQFGTPFYLDLWNSPYTDVRHMCAFGMTRAGKSVTMNHFVNEMIDIGGDVFIIDKGGSYKNNILLNKGLYIDSANLEVNIFTMCTVDEMGNYEYMRYEKDDGKQEYEDTFHLEFLLDFIILIWKGENKVEKHTRQILKDSIIAYYNKINLEKRNIPSFCDYWKFLIEYEKTIDKKYLENKYIDFESIRLSTKDFADGEFSRYFNADKNMEILNIRSICIDVKSVEKNKLLFELMCLVVMKMAINKTEGLPRSMPKFLLIDEAKDFLSGDIGEFIGGAYRKMGKAGGCVGIAAQDATFLDDINESVKQSIIKNTGILIVLGGGKRDAVINDLGNKFDLTEGQRHMIRTMNNDPERTKYREIFIKMGDHAIVPRVELSKKTLAIYSTTPEQMEEIEKMVKYYNGNVEMAVMQYLENKEKHEI